jgi:hypothetical protein
LAPRRRKENPLQGFEIGHFAERKGSPGAPFSGCFAGVFVAKSAFCREKAPVLSANVRVGRAFGNRSLARFGLR